MENGGESENHQMWLNENGKIMKIEESAS